MNKDKTVEIKVNGEIIKDKYILLYCDNDVELETVVNITSYIAEPFMFCLEETKEKISKQLDKDFKELNAKIIKKFLQCKKCENKKCYEEFENGKLNENEFLKMMNECKKTGDKNGQCNN